MAIAALERRTLIVGTPLVVDCSGGFFYPTNAARGLRRRYVGRSGSAFSATALRLGVDEDGVL
jgi:hypothetical protein